MPNKKTYNHAFSFAFSIVAKSKEDASDLTPTQIRNAIKAYLDKLEDWEIMENVAAPFDTFEVTK